MSGGVGGCRGAIPGTRPDRRGFGIEEIPMLFSEELSENPCNREAG